jgi:UDP-arabinose 4-epimerase
LSSVSPFEGQEMPNILVTGGAGYIGSHTCKALAAAGLTPVTFDNLSRGHADFVRWGPLVKGDILDVGALNSAMKEFRPTAVIHFAAFAYVGESVADPVSYYRNNCCGMVNVLDSMIKNGVERIVFSSSCTTYGLPDALPISETAPQRPISPYGRSKYFCEQIIKDAADAHQVRFGIFRYFNAAGADSSGDLPERHDPETHLIPLAVDAALGHGPPLHILGSDYPTPDGTCERDYIHVTDLATAHVKAVQHLGESDSSFEMNLGTGRAYSVLQVLSAVERVAGKPVPAVWAARRPGDPPALLSNPSLAQRRLGFVPQFSDLDTIIETTWRSRR